MPDIAAIATILTSIKTATDIAKALREANVSLEKAEWKPKLADLMTSLADARSSIAEVQQELIEKDQRIRALEEERAKKKKMIYAGSFYWLEENGQKDGPFCQRCYDVDGKAVRVHDLTNGYSECVACRSTYQNETSRRGRPNQAITDFDPRNI